MYDHEKSDPAIVAVKPTNKPGNRLRSWWSQGRGPRGMCVSKARAGTVPGNRVTGAEAHTEFRENITTRRYIPEVGAVCPNWARTDLCGGREVTRIPTAKVIG